MDKLRFHYCVHVILAACVCARSRLRPRGALMMSAIMTVAVLVRAVSKRWHFVNAMLTRFVRCWPCADTTECVAVAEQIIRAAEMNFPLHLRIANGKFSD